MSTPRTDLQSIVESTPDAVFAKDLEGRYDLINTSAGRIIGKLPSEVLGRDDFAIFPWPFAEAFRERDLKIIEGNETDTFEETAPTADGEYRIFETTKGPLRDEHGRVFGLYGVSRDISEQKRSEQALKQAKAFSENLIRTANVMILSFDSEGKIDIFNETAEEVTGYSAAELAGKKGFDLLVPKDRYPQVHLEFTRLFAGGMPKTFENPILTKAGEERHVMWQNNQIAVEGKGVATLSFGNDITERRQAALEKERLEQELLQAQKMESIGRLAGGVAHDFNNMLSVILGYSELIRDPLPADHPILKSVLEIEKAANRSKSTTQQLLAFSRKQLVSPKAMDLNDRIADTQKTLSHLIGEDVDLRFHPGADLWKIECDAAQIDQIVINLVVNSRDAMPEGAFFVLKRKM